MILAAAVATAGLPTPADAPPVTVINGEMPTPPVPAFSWRCQASTTDHQSLSLNGGFPAISPADQKNRASFNLRVQMQGIGLDGFSGSFPAALTFNLAGMANYSIRMPNPNSRISSYVLSFEFFQPSRTGFVNVAQFHPSTGVPTAFASGLCSMQVSS